MINTALLYPNSAHLGLSNGGFSLIYDTLIQAGQKCARFFFSEEQGLFSLDTKSSINSFNILLISASFQNDLLNLRKVYNIYAIKESNNIVIAGGIAVSINPLPFLGFADFAFIGEFEEFSPCFVNILSTGKPYEVYERLKGYDFLLSKEDLDQFSSPAETLKKIRDRYLVFKDFGKKICDINYKGPFRHYFHDLNLLELSRGCPHKCNFCYIGCRIKPVRFKDPGMVIDYIKRKKAERWGLISSCHSMLPGIDKILNTIINKNETFSLSSLDLFGDYEIYLSALGRTKSRSITIAPETFSKKLLKSINKLDIRDEFEKLFKLCSKYGINNIKMYLLIGFPAEVMDDIETTLYSINKTAEENRHLYFKANFSIFVPKPYTPFERERFLSYDYFKGIKKRCQAYHGRRHNLKITVPNYKYSLIDHVLSSGGTNITESLLKDIDSGMNNRALAVKYA